jgi:hypothetical protein
LFTGQIALEKSSANLVCGNPEFLLAAAGNQSFHDIK